MFAFEPCHSPRFAAVLMPVPPRLAATRSCSSSRSAFFPFSAQSSKD